MNSQEALDIIDKKLAKKVGKPPLKKSELIEAMAQALLKKRLEENKVKEAKYKEALSSLKIAVIKQFKLQALDNLESFEASVYEYGDKIRLNFDINFSPSLFPKELQNIKNNPATYYSYNKTNIQQIRQEIRQALIQKGPSRIEELLKDELVCKKFEQMAEEILAISAKSIELK